MEMTEAETGLASVLERLAVLEANHAFSLEQFLLPVLALVCWTLIVWLWMYATRIPAMQKAGIDPDSARHPGSYSDKLPASVRSVAENYNHLHEQPTIFYALMFFAALTGGADQTALYLAWAYAAIRVVHSFVQIVIGKVMLRFLTFSIGTIVLIVFAVREVFRVLG